MVAMLRRFFFSLSVVLTVTGLLMAAAPLRGQDQDQDKTHWTRKVKASQPSSRISVTILKAYNGKPIPNAAVIFHPIEGDRDKGALELKSDEDGKAVIDVIPVGDTVRLQVIANGYQTYGQDFKIDKMEMSMEVRLKRPVSQYSVYKSNGANSKSGDQKSGNSSNSSNPPAQGDTGSGSANQSHAQPNSQSAKSQNQDQSQSQPQSK
jgi:hypothetical protein